MTLFSREGERETRAHAGISRMASGQAENPAEVVKYLVRQAYRGLTQ